MGNLRGPPAFVQVDIATLDLIDHCLAGMVFAAPLS
jgi:hypothetical protein